MRVIHFTVGAGDALWGHGVSGVNFVPLLECDSITHVGCMHLASGGAFEKAILDSTCALLIVQGEATLLEPCWISLSGGLGIVMKPGERFRMESEHGAVIVLIESGDMVPTAIAISTPSRIAGQRWPGEI